MSRRRSRSESPAHGTTNSNDPRDLERRIFVGNLPTNLMDRKDMEDLFNPYGKINDVNMAAERRQNKAHSRPSPPRRHPYGGYGEGREDRTRSRSPMHGRESRDHRDGRDLRDPGREPRGHPREHDPRDPNFDRYRGPDGREKDPRGDSRGEPRNDPAYREEGYDRYYRMEDYYRKKEEPYPDRYREPWNGRRDPAEDRPRVEERRRNELYRQYYEELQRRYDSERPVDCSVIVVNKQQKEYAETVGRKVRDLGMVVDLIFLNTEVSLTQALEDVGRARTPFAIIITQQHQVHRSCTVNILFGTPQEHRNMPMQDAMVLVAHNYDAFKAEHRDKEREEIAQKAAKMADDVLMREHDGEGHPISLQPAIALLAESRYLTLEELDGLIEYLRDKRERLVRGSGGDRHAASLTAAPSGLEVSSPPSQTLPNVGLSAHPAPHSAHSAHAAHLPPASGVTASAVSSASATSSSHQQELQAKILSLFNSGSGSSTAPAPAYVGPMGTTPTLMQPSSPAAVAAAAAAAALASKMAPQSGLVSARPALRAPTVVGAPSPYGAPSSRMNVPQVSTRPTASGAGINFDNPSVQKALDTLIQSGPSINHLVNPLNPVPPRPVQGLGQSPALGHYGRHY